MGYVKIFTDWLYMVNGVLYSLCAKTQYLILLIGSLLLMVGVLSDTDIIKSLAIGILLMVACFMICCKVYNNEAMPLLGTASLILRFSISLIFNYIFNGFGMDSVEYHYLASDITELLHSGLGYASIPSMKQLFPNVVAVAYYAFGINRVSATFIVGFFAVLTGVVVYLVCRTSNMNRFSGYFASLSIWFMPGFLFFTSDLLKDSCILLVTAFSFYLYAAIIYKKSTLFKKSVMILTLMAAVAINSAFRFYAFAPIVVGFGLSLVIYFFIKRGVKTKLISSVLIFGFIALSYILANKYLSPYINIDINKFFDLINNKRESGFAYASAGIKGYDISTFGKSLKALPALCFHYLAQPFPSSWFTGGEIYIKLLIPDMLAWYIMLPFIFIGGYSAVVKKNIVGISMVGYLIVFLCINALIVGNVGAIYRYRLQFQELAFLLVGIGVTPVYNKTLKKP